MSVLVEAEFPLLFASVTLLAGIEATTVPTPVMPLTATLYVDGPPVTTAVVAPAVPERLTSEPVNPLTASLKTTVKLIGDAFVGSA